MTSNVPTTAETQKTGPTTLKPELSSGGTDEAITEIEHHEQPPQDIPSEVEYRMGIGPRKRREKKQDKGTRLLTHGRLTVTKVDGDKVLAECRGDSGEVYELGYENGRWNCSCLARTDCSHLSALWRVVVRPK